MKKKMLFFLMGLELDLSFPVTSCPFWNILVGRFKKLKETIVLIPPKETTSSEVSAGGDGLK